MPNRWKGYKRQPSVEGGRAWRSARLAPEVEKWVETEAHRFKVSIPFIISVALADYAGLKLRDKERY